MARGGNRDTKAAGRASLEARKLRHRLSLPDPIAQGVWGHARKAENEAEVMTRAAIDTIDYIEREVGAVGVPDNPVTIAEISLSNTLYASKAVNAALRKYHTMPDTGDALVDLKRDMAVAHLANATLRTLARVHEVYLRGQNTDRLAQILDEIRELDQDEDGIDE